MMIHIYIIVHTEYGLLWFTRLISDSLRFGHLARPAPGTPGHPELLKEVVQGGHRIVPSIETAWFPKTFSRLSHWGFLLFFVVLKNVHWKTVCEKVVRSTLLDRDLSQIRGRGRRNGQDLSQMSKTTNKPESPWLYDGDSSKRCFTDCHVSPTFTVHPPKIEIVQPKYRELTPSDRKVQHEIQKRWMLAVVVPLRWFDYVLFIYCTNHDDPISVFVETFCVGLESYFNPEVLEQNLYTKTLQMGGLFKDPQIWIQHKQKSDYRPPSFCGFYSQCWPLFNKSWRRKSEQVVHPPGCFFWHQVDRPKKKRRVRGAQTSPWSSQRTWLQPTNQPTKPNQQRNKQQEEEALFVISDLIDWGSLWGLPPAFSKWLEL